MSKRSADDDGNPVVKKQAQLGSWIAIPPPKEPELMTISSVIHDRSSIFTGFATTVKNAREAVAFQSYIRGLQSTDLKHPNEAYCEMLAYRIVAPKLGTTGINGPDDWTVKIGGDDDGEKGGSVAIRRVLESSASLDVAVVVSRWYGGIMLGPIRFDHISNTALEAITSLKEALELKESRKGLITLDTKIQELENKLDVATKTKALADYASVGLKGVKRLTQAKTLRLQYLEKQLTEKNQPLAS